GKTDLAVDVARRLPGEPVGGECICADSMQVYRGMNIATAKPTPEQRAAVPHHLLDLLDPGEEGFSVDTWLGLARQAVADVRGRGRYPIVVGGTNLYVQALLEGMADGPAPDAKLRTELEAADPAALRRRLEAIDPDAAARIHPNDRKRTIRAIEVHELVRIIGLDYSVEAINARINARVRAMIRDGLVDEVRQLVRGGGPGRQAAEALGYRQVLDHLAGRMSLEDAVEQIKIRTRRYARQQRTWLRRFRVHPQSAWIPADGISPQELVEKSLAAICRPPPGRPAGPWDESAGGSISERLS
ncbi:MAG: tRNA (adenosine(37)-N6)-dimethylallyltransferase, partial [Planctomycetota bacterium]